MLKMKTNRKLSIQGALSEIAFIFIGITLAIGVQNWNDRLKERKLELEYWQGFQHDLQWDRQQLEINIAQAERQVQQMDTLLSMLQQPNLSTDQTNVFFQINFFLTRETFFIPEKSTYNQLLSSSQGYVIEDKLLKDELFRYYTSAAREEQNNEKSVQLYQHHWVTPNIINAIVPSEEGLKMTLNRDYDFPNLNLAAVRTNDDYMTALVVRKEIANVQKGMYQRLLQTIDTILIRLDTHLEAF